MKKIGICTLCFANNFGAILQAFALQETLLNLGYDVEFLRLEEKTSISNESNAEEYRNSKKHLKIAEKLYDKTKDSYDAIIIGSDEVWNLKNNGFAHLDEYFGHNLNCNNIFTYAPSSNGTTKEMFNKFYNDNPISFDNLKNISVRDKHTQTLVKELSGRDAELVLDPTLLIENFEKYAKYPENDLKDYIAIYGYNFSDEEMNKITNFAKKHNKKIYSLGFEKDWCDTLNADIFEFLGYIKKADYVVTNTFHGTLFSIILEKNFAVFTNNSSKLNDVLNKFNLTNRDCMNKDCLNEILSNNINYNDVNQIKKQLREASLTYLKNSLNS